MRFLRGDYREAAEAFKNALRLRPDYVQALTGLGEALGKLGQSDQAEAALKQAIRIKPDDAGAHFALGSAYADFGNRGAALEEYERLKDLNPTMAQELFEVILWSRGQVPRLSDLSLGKKVKK
jgi:tetratricopeptide (TPR) repeat protein